MILTGMSRRKRDTPSVCWQATRGTAAQWKHVEADWAALAAKAGVRHIHAVDLFRRTKQFRGWKPEDVNALALSLDGVIARYLQLGFSVIVRDDDYKNIYGAGPHPRRPVKDTKYGVCFRAWLAFVPSFIASELPLRREREAEQLGPQFRIAVCHMRHYRCFAASCFIQVRRPSSNGSYAGLLGLRC
jgi:hypothetical protein